MKIKLFVLLLVLLCSITLMAQRPQRVPAAPFPITVAQSDGVDLVIRLHGDENMHFVTTTDGYVIVEGENGDYFFGKVGKDNRIIPSKYRARNEELRNKKTLRYLRKMAKDERLKKDVFVFESYY